MEDSMKRPLEDDTEIETKKIKIVSRSILDFSDCVLLNILSYLKPYDLYCLSKTCLRFKYLISDRKLWRKLDVREEAMCAKKFKFFFENMNNSTDTILVSGISKKEKTLTFSQFLKINKICDNLTVLAIENQYINSDEIGLRDFPESLKELSLRGTHIYGRQQFLHEAHLKLKKLHTLILADCKWFHEHSLMALSKLKSLENLSLYKCANLNDSVAYMSITAKFGFRKLLRIDARRTAIGDQFLKCFHCIKTLREIYLEAPERRRRRPRAAQPQRRLLDELQRLYKPQPQAQHAPHARQHAPHGQQIHPPAVVFNPKQLFKMRRDRLKSSKKSKKPANQPSRDSSFNCLENCEKCSLATCSSIPSPAPDGQSQSAAVTTDQSGLSAAPADQSTASDTAKCDIQDFIDYTPKYFSHMQHRHLLHDPHAFPPGAHDANEDFFTFDDASPSTSSPASTPPPTQPTQRVTFRMPSRRRRPPPTPEEEEEEEEPRGEVNADLLEVHEDQIIRERELQEELNRPHEEQGADEDFITFEDASPSTSQRVTFRMPPRRKRPQGDGETQDRALAKPSANKKHAELPEDHEDQIIPERELQEALNRTHEEQGPDEDFITFEDASPSTSQRVTFRMPPRRRRPQGDGETQERALAKPLTNKKDKEVEVQEEGKSQNKKRKLEEDSNVPEGEEVVVEVEEKEESDSETEETLYCDDVSDTEDEEDARAATAALLELEMLQADVTDSGVQWFAGATPDSQGPTGERSLLFRPPHHQRCSCVLSAPHAHTINAGPSGYKPLGSLPGPSGSSGSAPSPSNDSAHFNDVTVNVSGEGSVRLKITRSQSPPLLPSSSDEDDSPPAPPPQAPPPPFIHGRVIIQNSRGRVARGRDLRVIIERLDPGVHIVYDQGDYARDCASRLKVFVARGYRHVTNQALRSLEDLRLDLLDVTGTSVTHKGLKHFTMLNPDCRVVHDSTCRCPYDD